MTEVMVSYRNDTNKIRKLHEESRHNIKCLNNLRIYILQADIFILSQRICQLSLSISQHIPAKTFLTDVVTVHIGKKEHEVKFRYLGVFSVRYAVENRERLIKQ
jgi:hypothetical protein